MWRELERSAELQSSHPSTWHLTQSPLLLATGLSRLYMWRPDVQFSGWAENGLGLGWKVRLGYGLGFWFILGLCWVGFGLDIGLSLRIGIGLF